MDNIHWLIDYRPVDFDFRFANHEVFLFSYLKYAKLLRDMSYSCTNVIILNMIEDGVATNALDIFNWFSNKFDNKLRTYKFYPVGVENGPIQRSGYADIERSFEYVTAMDSVSPGWNKKQYFIYKEFELEAFTKDLLKRKIEDANNNLYDEIDNRDIQVNNMLKSPYVGEDILEGSIQINSVKESMLDSQVDWSVKKGKIDVKVATVVRKKGYHMMMYNDLKVDNEIYSNNNDSYYASEGEIDLVLFQHKIDKQIIIYVKQPNVIFKYNNIKVNRFGGLLSDFLSRIDPSWEINLVIKEIVVEVDSNDDDPMSSNVRSEMIRRENSFILKTITLNMQFLIMQKMLAIDKEFKSLTTGRDTLLKALVSISKNVANVLNIIMNFNNFDNFENIGVILPKPIPSEVLYYVVKAQKGFKRSGFDFVQPSCFFEVDYPPMGLINVEIEKVKFEVKWRVYKQKRGDDYNYLRVYLQEHKMVVSKEERIYYPVLYMIYHNNFDLFNINNSIKHYLIRPKMLEDAENGNCFPIRQWL